MLHNLYLISLIVKQFTLCFPIHSLNFSGSSKISTNYTKVANQDGVGMIQNIEILERCI